MFAKVLIANRGEIACRIIRTLRRLGIRSVAVYSEADIGSLHVSSADEAYCTGPAAAGASYLDQARLLETARRCGAEAIHPGYGFLSENAGFAEACAAAGIAFIGPTPSQIRDFGLKHTARALAERSGAPLLPGTGLLSGPAEAAEQAQRIGYPVMLKSTAGGGGIGMQICRDAQAIASAWDGVSRLSESNFKHGGIYLEKFVERARHIEVQVFGDGKGKVIALGERDCSAQRRNQKVIEETPAPGLSAELRGRLARAAVRLCESVGYRSAGTVEFVLGEEFYFLEVNTRLQVEHGVTEEVTGIDLVEWMIRLAAGELDDLESLKRGPRGHSIQARIYAENPRLEFRPSSGLLTSVHFPPGVRADTWVENGSEVSPFYDPLLAKLIVHGSDRAEALAKLQNALDATRLDGIETNLEFLRALAREPIFTEGRITTRFLSGFQYASHSIDVLQPGAQTTIQDYPGRVGYWDVGIPPSGPFDPLAFRYGNRILGNPEHAAGLEITVSGPTLRFNRDSIIVLTGASLRATLADPGIASGSLGNLDVSFWEPVKVRAGSVLKLGAIAGAGMRAYLCVLGGLDVPAYMGSRSTFTLGKFGGHGGRVLRAGDVLRLQPGTDKAPRMIPLPPELRPGHSHAWEIGVLYGPHGSPDYFTAEDIEEFFAATWEVHYNSNRTGVRLIGPKPLWARPDGGEAGLHPSNIHDNAYAIGSIDFTGDMPILLGPDGPSLGGFVCPAVIAQAELWKMGQVKPGDKIRFLRLTLQEARTLESDQEESLRSLRLPAAIAPSLSPFSAPSFHASTASIPAHVSGAGCAVLYHAPARGDRMEVRYRRSGDRNLLVEYGSPVLDLNLRFRVHALTEYLRGRNLEGVIDLTPGIRSLQIHFDSRILPMEKALGILIEAEDKLPAIADMEIPTRIVHMPLSWDDEAIHAVIRKYVQSVRADAPWCPSNIEFIRRINGLASIEDVYKTVFNAEYLVMGLGDVYLGAPVATPLDPRHRLVTTKYNPARTWTVENVVGIGGAYMCIYGMEGPGGYQLFGRTAQVWNTYRQTADFREGKPWLLRFFDQIRFHPVSGKELLEFREDFVRGRAELKIEPHVFRLREYNRFLTDNHDDIEAFRQKQQAAFRAERDRWQRADSLAAASNPIEAEESNLNVTHGKDEVALDGLAVEAHLSGNVWKILVSPGDRVEAEAPLLILESMKMEFTVTAPSAGTIAKVLCKEGILVTSGQALVLMGS